MLENMEIQTNTIPRLAYSLNESAHAIGLSRRMLYQLIDSGELRTIKLGRRRLVPRDELERLCRPQESAA
jgi:excisionase family DNA binding protein